MRVSQNKRVKAGSLVSRRDDYAHAEHKSSNREQDWALVIRSSSFKSFTVSEDEEFRIWVKPTGMAAPE